jgi:hypothetical protein
MKVAKRANYHGIYRVFLLKIDALEKDAFPVLDFLPELVLLEKMDDI